MARMTTGPGSNQKVGTPWELINVVKRHFPLSIDLAASGCNAKFDYFIDEDMNSLLIPWHKYPYAKTKWGWLNPEFGNILPWTMKCAEESLLGFHTVCLVPMDSAKWFVQSVPGKAGIWHLKGRIRFQGQEHTFPKDCALLIFHPHYVGSYRLWGWKEDIFYI